MCRGYIILGWPIKILVYALSKRRSKDVGTIKEAYRLCTSRGEVGIGGLRDRVVSVRCGGHLAGEGI